LPGRKERTNKVGGTTIAVIGVGKSVGVTYISISIAHYLRSLGYRVAVLERNKEIHFSCLEKNLWVNRENEKGFRYQGVDYYKDVGEEELLISSRYDYYVFDVGTGRNAIKEIARANCKIVIGLNCEWRMDEIQEFYDTYGKEEWFRQANFIMNMSNKYNNKGNKIIGEDFYYISYIWDKFKVKPEVRQQFRSIIGL
jgi:hypothetical protein